MTQIPDYKFYEEILHLIKTQAYYLYRTSFSDEERDYWFQETHTQHPQKLIG